MAFGGVLSSSTPGSASGAKAAITRMSGVTLGARLGAASIAAADTGELTSGTPAANQNQLPATFGRGSGNWVAGDEDLVTVDIDDPNANAQGVTGQTSIAYVSSLSVVGGQLVLRLHNRGGMATGSLTIKLTFNK